MLQFCSLNIHWIRNQLKSEELYQKLTPDQKNRGTQLAQGFVAKEEPRNPALEPPLPWDSVR
jgi:hypothetical protein